MRKNTSLTLVLLNVIFTDFSFIGIANTVSSFKLMKNSILGGNIDISQIELFD